MDLFGQSNFLQALGWAVLNSLWQIALLWVIYQLVIALFSKTSSAQKSFLASALLFAGFGWFAFTFLSIFFNEAGGSSQLAPGLVNIEGNEQFNEWLRQTLPVASVVYLILLIFPVLHFVRNYRFVQQIRNQGLSKANVEWRMFVNKVAAQLGITKKVKVWVSEMVSSPVTIGYLKPVILIPIAAVNNLSAQQLEAVLLHELAHIRRYDYFINLFIKFIQSILYFNPFVKAFVKIIEREREKSCDEMVIQYQYDPHGYASALLTLERADYMPKPLAVAAAGKKNDLLHRVEWIMGVQKKPVVSFNKLAGMLAGLLFIIAINAIIILNNPSAKGAPAAASISGISSPLYFFTDDVFMNEAVEELTRKAEMMAETTTSSVINEVKTAMQSKTGSGSRPASQPMPVPGIKSSLAEKINYITENPLAVAAAFMEQQEMPELKEYQEAQVKEAINASKKVLQEGQWKAVEKKLADVFTQQQKEQLKCEYQQEMNKMDWKKWEDKLRMAYDKVDWERVNIQLGQALNNVRLDSLTRVYNVALANLSEVEKEMNKLEISAIPDSDISIETVDRKKKEVEQTLNHLKAIRTKKIVRL